MDLLVMFNNGDLSVRFPFIAFISIMVFAKLCFLSVPAKSVGVSEYFFPFKAILDLLIFNLCFMTVAVIPFFFTLFKSS